MAAAPTCSYTPNNPKQRISKHAARRRPGKRWILEIDAHDEGNHRRDEQQERQHRKETALHTTPKTG
jgi:hypothetical protein